MRTRRATMGTLSATIPNPRLFCILIEVRKLARHSFMKILFCLWLLFLAAASNGQKIVEAYQYQADSLQIGFGKKKIISGTTKKGIRWWCLTPSAVYKASLFPWRIRGLTWKMTAASKSIGKLPVTRWPFYMYQRASRLTSTFPICHYTQWIPC